MTKLFIFLLLSNAVFTYYWFVRTTRDWLFIVKRFSLNLFSVWWSGCCCSIRNLCICLQMSLYYPRLEVDFCLSWLGVSFGLVCSDHTRGMRCFGVSSSLVGSRYVLSTYPSYRCYYPRNTRSYGSVAGYSTSTTDTNSLSPEKGGGGFVYIRISI